MRILSLDIGKRRTGVAFADDIVGIPLALDTVIANDEADLVAQILQLCDEREIDLLVIGLPLLPSGEEGTQSSFVRLIGSRLEEAEVSIEYLDERYTTQKHGENDGDARAACQLLSLFLDRSKNKGTEND